MPQVQRIGVVNEIPVSSDVPCGRNNTSCFTRSYSKEGLLEQVGMRASTSQNKIVAVDLV